MDTTQLSSNWKKLQASLKSKEHPTPSLKRKRAQPVTTIAPRKQPTGAHTPRRHKKQRMDEVRALSKKDRINGGLVEGVDVGRYVAMDCEMVGVGPGGTESALARVSIVNYNGEQVYDSFVLPKESVTDWRTPVSGIRPSHMKEARTLEEIQSSVATIMKGRIVVGHALRHDFQALMLDHPRKDVRDTARHAPYKKIAGGSPKLSLLASELLGLEIQTGEHSSIEDARAAMLLFRRDKDRFERRQ